MTYDAARQRVVLFGGNSGPYLDETWTWDGVTWTQRHPAQSPTGRGFMGLAYDAARRQVVLFAGGGGGLDDTWTWDGNHWQQRRGRRLRHLQEGDPADEGLGVD